MPYTLMTTVSPWLSLLACTLGPSMMATIHTQLYDGAIKRLSRAQGIYMLKGLSACSCLKEVPEPHVSVAVGIKRAMGWIMFSSHPIR